MIVGFFISQNIMRRAKRLQYLLLRGAEGSPAQQLLRIFAIRVFPATFADCD